MLIKILPSAEFYWSETRSRISACSVILMANVHPGSSGKFLLKLDTYFYSSFYTNTLLPAAIQFTNNYHKWYSKDLVSKYPTAHGISILIQVSFTVKFTYLFDLKK